MFWVYTMFVLVALGVNLIYAIDHADEIEELIIEVKDIIEERKRLRVE